MRDAFVCGMPLLHNECSGDEVHTQRPLHCQNTATLRVNVEDAPSACHNLKSHVQSQVQRALQL